MYLTLHDRERTLPTDTLTTGERNPSCLRLRAQSLVFCWQPYPIIHSDKIDLYFNCLWLVVRSEKTSGERKAPEVKPLHYRVLPEASSFTLNFGLILSPKLRRLP